MDTGKAVPNNRCHECIATLTPFRGSNLRAEKFSDGTYRIYSYWTLMAEIVPGQPARYNAAKYSRTTTRHQSYIVRGLTAARLWSDAVSM